MASVDDMRRTRMQTAAMLVAGTFLLVGILGFVPGITSNFDDMKFAGHDSDAKLLGLFQVSVLHNIVHLLFGVIGLAAARTWNASKTYLIWGGAIYLALFVYGLIVGHDDDANFVPFNVADDLLHLGLGVTMIGLGVALSRSEGDTAVAGRATTSGSAARRRDATTGR